jgi:glycosyltransferase involved in cell wall biosynthesis
MHVAIVALHRPEKPTGVCRHAANLAHCLASCDSVTQVSLITGAWQGHYFRTVFGLTDDKIKILEIDIPNQSISRNRWFLFSLPKLLHQLQPQIVHLAFPLPIWRSRMPCPVVTTIHDLYPFELPENFGRQAILNRWILQLCIHQSNALVCISQTTLASLKRYVPGCDRLSTQALSDPKAITVIYNYVDFNAIAPAPPFELLHLVQQPFLFCVAQHRPNKNLDLLIAAFAELITQAKMPPQSHLMILGSPGPQTLLLQQQIATLGLGDRVHLVASLADAQLVWLYQHCAAFVIPSSTEGFCLPLAEALACNCPAVCSDIPIFREIGSTDCLYFSLQPDSRQSPVQNLAEAIAQALITPPPTLRPSLPTSRFSKQTTATQLLHLYSTLSPLLPIPSTTKR